MVTKDAFTLQFFKSAMVSLILTSCISYSMFVDSTYVVGPRPGMPYMMLGMKSVDGGMWAIDNNATFSSCNSDEGCMNATQSIIYKTEAACAMPMNPVADHVYHSYVPQFIIQIMIAMSAVFLYGCFALIEGNIQYGNRAGSRPMVVLVGLTVGAHLYIISWSLVTANVTQLIRAALSCSVFVGVLYRIMKHEKEYLNNIEVQEDAKSI